MSARPVASRLLPDTGHAAPAPGSDAARASRIVMVDPAVVGQSHLLVNTGFIRLLLSRFDDVVVIAETTHREALESYLDADSRAGRPQFISYASRKEMLARLREEIARAPTQAVLLTNLHYALFARLSIVSLLRKVTLFWVLHSHLSSLARDGLRDRIKNRLKIFLLFDMFPASHFIVCGESIKSSFLRLTRRPCYQRRISAVFHPVGISAVDADRRLADAPPAARAAPSLIYLQGWHKATAKTSAALERLSAIARTGTIRLDVVWNNFSSTNNRKHFTKDYRERLCQIARADFFLFLPSDDYALQASGALLDLVVAATPAIGINTAFGAELATIIGEFGFFFDTLDELVNFMTAVDRDFLLRRHAEFRRNLKRGGTLIGQTNAAQLSRLGAAFAAGGIDDNCAPRLAAGAK
jgi:hypothetical protein